MPAFPAGAVVVEKVQDFSMSYVWVDGTKRSRIMTDIDAAVAIADLEELAERSAGLSNAALIKYQGAGVSRQVAISNVLVYDEAHGIDADLIMTFQKEDTLDTFQWRIPAPDAALFTGGVILKDPTDAVQGARILACINAVNTVKNEGLGAGAEWLYVSGYLSTAKAAEKRQVPPTGSIEEPPAGSPADDPAETPAP